MAILSGIHCCPKCNKETHWKCSINERCQGYDVHSNRENQHTYTPIILSTNQAKVHVLCFVCEECGEIDIVKEKSRNTHNPYKLP